MKKVIFLLTLFSLLSLAKASAQFEGTFGMGVHAAYGAEINSLGAGVHIHYYRTNNVRFVPAMTFFHPRNGVNKWTAEADAHYILPVSPTILFYPIAGLSFLHQNFDASRLKNSDESNWTKNRLGANLGLGLQHDFRFRLRWNFDVKYNFAGDYSQMVFMAGIGFWI
jgi:hypothetical protein